MKMAETDDHAREIRDAFMLQVSKDIGSMACVLKGKVDAVIVTGGIAYNEYIVSGLKEAAEWMHRLRYIREKMNFWHWHRGPFVC